MKEYDDDEIDEIAERLSNNIVYIAGTISGLQKRGLMKNNRPCTLTDEGWETFNEMRKENYKISHAEMSEAVEYLGYGREDVLLDPKIFQ